MSDEFGINMDVTNELPKEDKPQTKEKKENDDVVQQQILDNIDEQTLLAQKNASNMAAEALNKAE